MDPITAVGFAAAIVAFIDFSHKVVSGTLEVLQSGSTTANAHLSEIMGDLHNLTAELSNQPPGQSEHEVALASLASQCQEVSRELVKLLNTLKTEKVARWESVRVALRSMRKKDKVQELEDRLSKYRSQILVRMSVMLNDRQLAVHLEIQKLQSQSKEHFEKMMKELTVFRDQILGGVQKTLERYDQEKLSDTIQEELRLMREIRGSLLSLLDANDIEPPEIRILKQIMFKSIHDREDSVVSPESDTFKWILDENDEQAFEDDRCESGPDAANFEDGNDEAGEQAAREFETQTRTLRSEARNHFLTWLREGDDIFHISGKAGSGKSTMMKLLLQHPRTLEDLQRWAGEKQLIFGSFFFWRSGDKMQNSLQGLYRSMLFHALKQRPELIPTVFPKAYREFLTVGPKRSIDSEYFRAGDFDTAFTKLISLPTGQGWKLAFFIDGLDEYGEDGADRMDHLTLATRLEEWVTHDGVKILVTSRPFSEFQYSFTRGIRIDLHALTAGDIFRFGRGMFLKFKGDSPIRIKDHYLPLLKSIVDRSDGVFLWARLTIRTLLVALPQHKDIKSLEKHLDEIPPLIHDHYTNLLKSISTVSREKAFKILLLVSNMPDGWFFDCALIVTWIESLDEPTWPMSCDLHAYTEEELTTQYRLVESQLDSLTMGLLELRDIGSDEKNPFFHKRVQFFHRTVRDFVRQSAAIQKFSVSRPGLTNLNTYARLMLAELWFCETRHLKGREDKYCYFLAEHESQLFVDELFDGYWKAFDHHNAVEIIFSGRHTWPGGSRLVVDSPRRPLSFLHRVAFRFCQPEYVAAHVSRRPELLEPQEILSLLFSAGYNRRSNGDGTLRALLDLGASLDDPIQIVGGVSGTVWTILLPFLAARMVSWDGMSTELCVVFTLFEHLLSAGPDTDCVILLGRRRPYRLPAEATHFISLRELVKQLRPANFRAISRFMELNPSEKGIWEAIWESFYGLVRGKNPRMAFIMQEVEGYLPFNMEMQPNFRKFPVRREQDSTEDEASDEDSFGIYSVRWPHTELKCSELRMRVE